MFDKEETGINLDDAAFQIAFAVRDYRSNTYKNDPAYVTWRVDVFEGDGSTDQIVQTVDTHLCNDEDWSKFYPPSKSSKAKIEFVKREKVMMCMNKTDTNGKLVNKKLFGVDDVHPHRRIDLVILTLSTSRAFLSS